VVTVTAAIEAVKDPEIRVLTIADLGILRAVEVGEGGRVTVTITPTYTGCPAMDVIRHDIVAAARKAGAVDVEVRTELSPPWSTDWISETGRAKLAAAGTAPPHGAATATGRTMLRLTVRCPRCGSADTEELSRFGSTACKSLWRCRSCREPFDSMKAH
jgi:ring-1,2-phenylacetyl-CoA epoxidase subunit PaaD